VFVRIYKFVLSYLRIFVINLLKNELKQIVNIS